MDNNATIYIAGHRGLVGSAILRSEYVFLAAAKVGGIHATREVLISVYEGFPQRAFPQ